MVQVGLLASGQGLEQRRPSYSPAFPSLARARNSGNAGFRSQLQRRDREGLTPSSLTLNRPFCRGTLGDRRRICQADGENSAKRLTNPGWQVREKLAMLALLKRIRNSQ